MNRSPNPITARTLAVAAAGLLAGAAAADMVPISDASEYSTEGLGHFSGSITYTFLGGTAGRLDVSLTNTTAASVGGYITAFMFRTPAEAGTVTSSLTAWDNNLATSIPPGASGVPFPGSWIGGAGLTASWLAGGSPTAGIAVGSTGTWSFAIAAASASTLTASSFIRDTVNTDIYAFIVRFRGMIEQPGGTDSDKVPGRDLPAPGAAALVGMASLMTRRRTA
jgi:hypothetical protein